MTLSTLNPINPKFTYIGELLLNVLYEVDR